VEAVQASGITKITKKKTLILPQLSAGGVAAPLLKSEAPDFPFNILYGPVWVKYLPQFLAERPAKKPDKMKLAKFTVSHRFRAWITHTTFLMRKIFFWPSIAILLILIGLISFNILLIEKLWIVGEIWIWLISINFLIAILLPITNFTRKFMFKGVIFGAITILLFGGISWFLNVSLPSIFLSLCFYFWIAFFSTMSFSGYTMATSPKEIQNEYPIFSKINMILLIIGLCLKVIGFIFF
ncbi:MAG: hypothetical protein ACFFDH_24410, partial [Promethearchaeota archaeon]